MVEWFKNLDVAWQTTIFGAGLAIALAAIGGLLKLLSRKESHTGVDLEVLKAALKVLGALEMVDTYQSNKLVSELKKISDEKLNAHTEHAQEKYNSEQKHQLEKGFQLYAELWKALIDLRSSIIITPTLDRVPEGKPLYEVYKERSESAADAFNKAKNLFENNRPFYHDDVSKITGDLLSECRGYINSVARMLKSESFDDELHDKADELLEKVPKAIDEIEKAIKRRIGLSPKSKIDDSLSIGPGLESIVQITKGSITYQSNTSNFKPLIGLKMFITGEYIKRNDFGKLEAYIETLVPFQSLQRLNEKLGLHFMRLFSENSTVSVDPSNPTVFTASTKHILPKGEKVLNLSTWQEEPLPMNFHVQTQTTASGHLEGKVFQGKFEAILTYDEIDLQVGLNGDFQVHLA